MKAPVFDTYFGSSHDGPGLRTVFFLQGCPLKCAWCHNPEGILERRIWWDAKKCIGCGECLNACDYGALTFDGAGARINNALCVRCGECVRNCPGGALKLTSADQSVDELTETALNYRNLYLRSGGGVTVSGGEPLAHAEFVNALFRSLKSNGIRTALDTCGCAPSPALERALEFADLALYDIKLTDARRHRDYTGVDNALILANFETCLNWARRGNALWARTPLIPGYTDDATNIMAIARLLSRAPIERWELMAFNNLCADKYRRLGMDWPLKGLPLLTREQLARARHAAMCAGFPEDKLVITGLNT